MAESFSTPSGLIPVDDARKRILQALPQLKTQTIKTQDSVGRYLAKPVVAQRTQPPFNASAMDGYALRSADIETAITHFNIIGTSAAGTRFEGEVNSGQTVRIFTGAPLPKGADTVVMQENAKRDGDQVAIETIPPPLTNVRKAGSDFSIGDELVPSGVRIGAARVAAIASAGLEKVEVICQPKISVISTGDELAPLGAQTHQDQIISTNELALRALIEEQGGENLSAQIVADRLEAVKSALLDAQSDGADIIVTSGGASVGDHDYLALALEELGAKIETYKVAMRPGKPFIFSKLSNTIVLSLPGNPISSLICAKQFLVPALVEIQGGTYKEALFEAVLTKNLSANGPREHYLRGHAECDDQGRWRITPAISQDSSLLSVAASCNALIKRAPLEPETQAGGTVKMLFLNT